LVLLLGYHTINKVIDQNSFLKTLTFVSEEFQCVNVLDNFVFPY
jgi:hypothetical protein